MKIGTNLKLGQVVFLGIFGIAAIWGGFTGYNRLFLQETKAAATQGQITAVTRGSLQARVAASGAATITRQTKLSFGTAGTLGDLTVKMGSEVKAGQVLANLDPSTVATLQNSVIQAEANVNIANMDVESALSPYNAVDVAASRRNVQQAQANLDLARLDLDSAQNPYTSNDLAAAQRAVQQAEANLAIAMQDLDSSQNPYSDLDMSLAESAVQSAAVALENARRSVDLAENDPTNNDNIRRLEYESIFYENAYIKTKDKFQDGNANQDKLDLDYGNMLTAKEKLAAARQKKDVSMASARNDLAKAQDGLAKAQDDLAKKKSGADSKAVDKQNNIVLAAETALEKARDDLATRQAGADIKTVAKQSNGVLSAQTALEKARDDLSTKLSGPDARAVEKARNQVISAEANLNTAKEKLKGATLTAPFDGVVSAVNLNVGEQVGASTAVLSLVDPQALRIDVNVAESDIATLKAGQTAQVTFDALTGQNFTARLDAISPSAKVQQGVVNYPVTLVLDKASGVKDGMSASAQIVYDQRDNVLLVPNRAIKTQGRTRTVQVVLADGTNETRTVQTGMAGEQSTEVTSGLREGDRVLIPATSTSTRGVPGAGGLGGAAGGFAPPAGGQLFIAPR